MTLETKNVCTVTLPQLIVLVCLPTLKEFMREQKRRYIRIVIIVSM
jgi:hypothetical protein